MHDCIFRRENSVYKDGEFKILHLDSELLIFVRFNKDDANNTSYYPAVGYRSAGQLKNNGFACYYWAANAQVDGTNLIARGLSNERSKGANGFNMGGKFQTQYALPIRCMKQ